MPGINRPSLIDRLLDDHYESEQAGEDWGLSVEQLKRSVVRDLNDLVNTARPAESGFSEVCTELPTSICCYGLTLPGLLGKSAVDRQRVRHELEQTIRIFEPRLRHARVEDVEGEGDRNLDANILPYAFRIRAELRLDPLPEDVFLDATLTRYPQTIRIAPSQAGPPPKEGDHD